MIRNWFMKKYGYSGTITKTIEYESEDRDPTIIRAYEVVWDVDGYYYPGQQYKKNGDPGDPPEGEENIVIATINGYDADRYLKHLAYWNAAVFGFLTFYAPDLNYMVRDDPADKY